MQTLRVLSIIYVHILIALYGSNISFTKSIIILYYLRGLIKLVETVEICVIEGIVTGTNGFNRTYIFV